MALEELKLFGPEAETFLRRWSLYSVARRTGREKLHLPMKTIPVSLVAGLLLPIACLAEPEMQPNGKESGGKGNQRPQGPFMEVWKAADSDQDGFLSKSEFEAMSRVGKIPEDKRKKLFSRLDKNSDEKLDRKELDRLGKPDGENGRPMKRLWELDSDQSGGINLKEFKNGELFKKLPLEKQEEVFKRLDTNGDGVVSPADRPEFPHKRGQKSPDDHERHEESGRVNERLDLNGDGAISFEEFRSGSSVKHLTEDQQEDRFDLLDRNQDQKITPEDVPSSPGNPAEKK